MSRVWRWQCKRCGAELAIVEDGRLYPKPGLPVCVDPDGAVRVTCTAMLDGGRLCGQRRTWVVKRRRPPDAPDMLESDRTALSARRL